jgi:hypothetical protein
MRGAPIVRSRAAVGRYRAAVVLPRHRTGRHPPARSQCARHRRSHGCLGPTEVRTKSVSSHMLPRPGPRLIEKGVRLAQKMQVGPCIPVGIQRLRAAVGPTSGPTWRLSHFGRQRLGEVVHHRVRKERHREVDLPRVACVWTGAHCHSSLSFVVPMGILHVNENWGSRMTKFPRLSRLSPSPSRGRVCHFKKCPSPLNVPEDT